MATILAHIRVRPGRETEFENLARELFHSSHALEDALLRYEYWRGQEAGCYYTLLSFGSYADFIAHQVSPHHERAATALGAVIADLRLEWLDPVEGASDLPRTEAEDLAADPDPAVRRAARHFPADIAAWWSRSVDP